MARRPLMALLLCALAAAPAAAQSDSSTLRVREAAAALVRGNVDQAITIYGEVLEDKSLPNDRRATILNDRGVAFSRRQQQKEAIEDFNRAIQLYPEYAAVYNNRGNVLLGLGAVREAVKDFDRALLLAPGYAAAYSNRAGAYMRISRFFIERPIFAAVVSLVVTIIGAIGYLGLGITQLPEIIPPTITVSTSFPGASAQTVADTVAAPIEQEVNGVEGMAIITR